MSYRSYSNYDSSSYGRSRETNRIPASNAADRPTSVTAKYLNTSHQKSSSIPVLSSEQPAAKDSNPISTIANRYLNYGKFDKPTIKYDKKDYSEKTSSKFDKKTYSDKSAAKFDTNDYSKISVPKLNRSHKELSPVAIPSKYSITRLSRQISPERKSLKNDKSRDSSPVTGEKNIPNKTNKSTSYSLSSYKLYPRSSSYVRPSSRTETKPEITVNRYAIANRLSTTYLGTPTRKSASVSPTFSLEPTKPCNKNDHENSLSPVAVEEDSSKYQDECNQKPSGNIVKDCNENEDELVTYITRHTSPTPPGSSVYVRTRRADMAKTIEKTVKRSKRNIEMVDKEIQSDRLDDTARTSRFVGSVRTSTTNWSYYTPHISSYTGYAGRYSTQYSNLRDSGNYSDRSSQSKSHELQSFEENCNSEFDNEKKQTNNSVSETNELNLSCIEENQDIDTTEVVINVNLKLKRTQSPQNTTTTEFISPEITITNSQLPPQAPKSEIATKPKKVKARKSNSNSDSDSSAKKKTVRKKSKSSSPSDSDNSNGNVSNNKSMESSQSKISQSKSTTNLRNRQSPIKHSKARESQSPESSITLSTQSSVSEDDSTSKLKTNDASRTSADETSIPTDHSDKKSSPILPHKNDNVTEEAKSFLIRALAPVTNLFKIKHQDSSEHNNWLENSISESTGKDVSNLITESDKSSKGKNDTSDIVASNNDNLVKLKSIRRIESGEKAWWLESDSEQSKCQNVTSSEKNTSNKVANNPEENIRWSESNGEVTNKCNDVTDDSNSKYLTQCKFMDDEKPWWLDSSANIPEGIERLTPPRKSSSESEKSEKYNFFKVRHIDSGEKDWWLTSNENSSNSNSKPEHQNSKSLSDQKKFPLRRIRHVESGERPWWLSSDKNIPEGIERLPTPPPQNDSDSSDSEEVQLYVPPKHTPPFPTHIPNDEPLGTRRSPEGLETPKQIDEFLERTSSYKNNLNYFKKNQSNSHHQKGIAYISRYTDIDDILGTSGQIYSPFMDSILAKRTGQVAFDEDECEEIDPTQVRIHDSTPQRPVIKKLRGRGEIADYGTKLDDATLQVFKDGDYGPYLDLDSTLNEQEEDIEGLQDSRKNAIILRTQLSVRVHSIIERLLHSQGRELRRALFTLKQILQSDKDLVHEFVANKGLDCLMQVSNMADHNYLDYILRALGQILLYVDGMHGVMAHKRCIQWLYSLISSKYRHVVKTALKLLLVFVEYTEKNCLLLIDAINTVDLASGKQPWYNIMKILKDFDASDTELLIYATTLINRCLNNVPDRDTYYDQVDALQEQGMDDIIQLYMSKQGTDLDLLRQLQIFESVLLYEDGDESGTALKQLDESVINSVRRRSHNLKSPEIRKSKKQLLKEKASHSEHDPMTASNQRLSMSPTTTDNKENKDTTSAIRRRRDRYSRQAHHIQQQEMMNSIKIHIGITDHSKSNYTSRNNIGPSSFSINGNVNNINVYGSEHYANYVTNGQHEDNIRNGNQRYTAGLKQRIQNGTLGHSVNAVDAFSVIRQKQLETPDIKDDREILLNREHSIKDLAQRLTSPVTPTTEDKPLRVSDMAGIVSKAKEELAKSQSKEVIKSPTIEITPKIHDIKISENDIYWEELKKGCLNREFHLCDLDFSDLRQDSDDDVWSPAANAANCPPPPPPAMFNSLGNPPPMPKPFAATKNSVPSPPPKPPFSSELSNDSDSSTIKKNKKTVKLFWREIQENPAPANIRPKIGGFIWDDLPEVPLDTKMLEYLFESKTNDLIIKEKLMEPKRNLILDAKRSNAINIAMKKLPTPQTIKAAIMKMDATVIGREGIEKLLTMLPTEEEKIKIQEAQYANPDLPLGSAEQFLLTLASINELSSRLKLWVFKLDFDNLEKEIAEPLMDLKQGIQLLKINKTFKVILSTLRSVGSFLNGSQVKGFRLEYLSKVMEVKDTVHKHPLLYHICEMIIIKFPDSTDFFSEVGPVIRASKVDFDIISTNLMKLEADCKASWDHMKKIAKHDSSQIFKTKINEFLTDAAERIILLTIIEKRVMSRYNKFLLYLGVPPTDLSKTKPSDFLKVIAEFALEYRTTRERVLQQLEKRANHRERNKTRGKMIVDVGNFSTKNGDHTADSALKELLKTDPDTDSLTENRRKSKASPINRKLLNGDVSADDEIIETLVRSATSKRRPMAKDRRRNRISDKKNLNRTLDGTQSWPCTENNPG